MLKRKKINEALQEIVDSQFQGKWSRLAKQVGISESTLQKVKEGADPRFSTIEKICTSLDIGISEFLGEIAENTYQKNSLKGDIWSTHTPESKNYDSSKEPVDPYGVKEEQPEGYIAKKLGPVDPLEFEVVSTMVNKLAAQAFRQGAQIKSLQKSRAELREQIDALLQDRDHKRMAEMLKKEEEDNEKQKTA